MARFDITSEAFKRAPHDTLSALVQAGPFVDLKIPILGKMAFATQFDAAMHVLKDKTLFAVDGRNAGLKSQFGLRWLPKTFQLLGRNMLTQDDPDHRRLRKLADGPFRAIEIDALRPAITTLADQLIDDMERSDTPDLVEGFCRPLPLMVICELLGLPLDDRPKFMRWMENVTNAKSVISMVTLLPSLRKIMSYLRAEVERRRVDPAPGLITQLVQAEADGDRLSEDELLANIFVLFVAGHETTTHLLSTAVLTLIRQTGVREELCADWALARGAVDELMRYNSPVQMTKPRFIREDTELFGRSFKKGDKVMAMLAAANMDPREFENPSMFDIHREKNRQMGFGGGMHLCLGIHLAKAEAEIGLERLFTRWPQLGLAVEESSLRWIRRAGLRGLTALPLSINSDQMIRQAA
ncbi:MAG: cytochrome P450 [Pseudomonadota bacterium]